MQNLASYAAALAMALECIRDCGDSRWALTCRAALIYAGAAHTTPCSERGKHVWAWDACGMHWQRPASHPADSSVVLARPAAAWCMCLGPDDAGYQSSPVVAVSWHGPGCTRSQTVTSKEGCLATCRPVELLRKESLAGLAPAAACRVLSHAYAAVVPITPLPYPPLPLNPTTPGGLGTAELHT